MENYRMGLSFKLLPRLDEKGNQLQTHITKGRVTTIYVPCFPKSSEIKEGEIWECVFERQLVYDKKEGHITKIILVKPLKVLFIIGDEGTGFFEEEGNRVMKTWKSEEIINGVTTVCQIDKKAPLSRKGAWKFKKERVVFISPDGSHVVIIVSPVEEIKIKKAKQPKIAPDNHYFERLRAKTTA